MTKQQFGLEFCVVQLGTFYHHQDYEEVEITKNFDFTSLVDTFETSKSQLFYNWFKIGRFQPLRDKFYFFHQQLQPRHDVMQKELDNLDFVHCVPFEFINSVTNNGTKYLPIFDNSCEAFAIRKRSLILTLLEDIVG